MGYEINFIGVSEETKDADAIALRWETLGISQVIGIYDGGNQKYGEELGTFLDNYFFSPKKNCIDFIVCSHSDMDHSSGLKHILENYKVKKLYMNRPWLYVDEFFPYIKDGRITQESLTERLRNSYSYIAGLEDIANKKGIEICEAFAGTSISEEMCILSPSKEFYLQLLTESQKTPLTEDTVESFGSLVFKITKYIKTLIESWTTEYLKEEVTTSAENEMSVICLGCDYDKKDCFLLTGDAGIRALSNAIQFTEDRNFSIKEEVNFIQIPHHGGRHNISSSLLNRLIGNIVPKGTNPTKTGFCSVGKNSDHPLQMVVNAFTRRGVKVYKTDGASLCHHVGINFNRPGWSSATKEDFNDYVEKWED
ncbi:hypothetical protein [Treponema vincentii]|uniref:hypothetical protein n=1 Tax=Treponema vincentii TaxID=69710 RepID=UPI0020A57DA3|nr:hypothetical protein [Treponema vincentii]UTC49038.1 hypothetical protein E4N73_09395 [Treponema vincentii]